jgi:DNA topoisomerase-1
MQYCYDITGAKDIPADELKNYVRSIYTNKKFGEDAFVMEEVPPFVVIYTRDDNRVCISLTTRGKKNIQKIEAIHEKLNDTDLLFRGAKMSHPYIFGADINKWWEGDRNSGQTHRWSSLVHRGPYFTHIMEPYELLGARLIYDKKKYVLSPMEERVLGFYAKRKISEEKGGVVDMLTKDDVFNANYFGDLKDYLTKEHLEIFKNFDKFDFSDIVKKIVERSETEAAVKDVEVKRNKKVKMEERKMEYGYAMLDGVRERVGNFIIEPAAIFYGRGNNPKRGKIKPDINPEEVTINVGPHDLVPKPPNGHTWKEVITDQNAVWLSKWRDPTTESTKYIMFSAEGRFKGESDLAKYEKARKLNKYIEKIREEYKKDVHSNDVVKKQLGTVLFLIDNFGIRVGNEKEEDEADTVGATTLRVNHVDTNTKNHIIFDFLGKDSVRFFKDLIVPSVIYENVCMFQKGKRAENDLFDRISSDDINSYLKKFDNSFSAKVFRTRLASTIMFNALKGVKIPNGSTKIKIKNAFNEANSEVAKILNHTRNVPKKTEEKVKKLREELDDIKKNKGEKKKIETLEEKIKAMSDVMNVAITTSLNNYIDPRLVVAWAKTYEVPVDFIYSGTLMKKFDWAISSTEGDWDYINAPIVGEQKLQPPEREEGESTQGRERISRKKDEPKPKPKHIPELKPKQKPKHIEQKKSVPRDISIIQQTEKNRHEKIRTEQDVLKEKEKYLSGVPRDVLGGLSKLKYHEQEKWKNVVGERRYEDIYTSVEQKHYEKLSRMCKEKPFKLSILETFPSYVTDFFVPYAAEARKRGIVTEFGDAILLHYARKHRIW